MKKILLFTLLFIAFFPALAQQKTNATLPTDSANYKIFKNVEVNPKFPGGDTELMKYVAEHLHVNMGNKPEGITILNFIVTEIGEIKDITVIRSLEPSLDSAAIQVVKGMPNWIPGTQKGQNVKVRYALPVRFSKETGKHKTKTKRKN